MHDLVDDHLFYFFTFTFLLSPFNSFVDYFPSFSVFNLLEQEIRVVAGNPTSVTVNFSNFSNFSGNEVFFPMLFNQLKNGFLWNSNFWKIIFYAFQILKRKFLCFSPTWKSYFMVFSLHFRVLNLYFFGFFLTASASSTEKRKWLLHMSLFKYSLVV